MQSKNFLFWVLTVSVLCALVLPVVLKDGMFMDGLLYACTSKNLADGIGSFWFPHFSKMHLPFFNQQPPLGFEIQSLFFKVLGASIYTERIYSFLACIITACIINVVWRIIFPQEKEIKQMGWLPVFFWITIPVCFWSYANNILENTMTVFDLFAVIFILKFFLQKQNLLFILIAGIFVFLASLTKGIQGVFPIAAIFFGWVAYRNVSFVKMIGYSILLTVVPFTIYFLLLQNDSVFLSLTIYFNNRVLHSIRSVSTVDNRLFLVGRLVSELIPALVVSLLIILATIKTFRQTISEKYFSEGHQKHSLFFLLVGISASFPLMITLEQSGFYLVTSLPYFALSISFFVAPLVSRWIEKINMQRVGYKISKVISLLLLSIVLIYSGLQIGKFNRDEEMLHDVHLIGKEIPRATILGSTPDLWQTWSLQEYLIRHYYICQDSVILPKHDYLLLESEKDAPVEMKIQKVNIPTVKYHLYKVVK